MSQKAKPLVIPPMACSEMNVPPAKGGSGAESESERGPNAFSIFDQVLLLGSKSAELLPEKESALPFSEWPFRKDFGSHLPSGNRWMTFGWVIRKLFSQWLSHIFACSGSDCFQPASFSSHCWCWSFSSFFFCKNFSYFIRHMKIWLIIPP